MGLSPIRAVRSERAADEFFRCYQMPPCPTKSAEPTVEIGGQCDPNTGRWFYGRYMRKLAGGTTVAFNDCVSRKLSQKRK